MIEHQARLGNVLRQALTASGWQIVNETPLPLVCFTREHLDPAAFLAALHRRQIAWMSEARIGGAPVLRPASPTSAPRKPISIRSWTEMNQLFQQGVGASLGAGSRRSRGGRANRRVTISFSRLPLTDRKPKIMATRAGA